MYQLPLYVKALNANQHRRVVATGIDHDAFLSGLKINRWPVGATYVAILQTVYEADPAERKSPKLTTEQKERMRAMKDRAKPAMKVGPMDADRAEMLRKISELPDAKKISAEQSQYRGLVNRVIGTEKDAAE